MKPKFEVGQKVKAASRRRNRNVIGTIVEVSRCFAEVDGSGRFVRGGLAWNERDIASISVPHTFDGTTLTITTPEEDYGTWVQKAQVRSYCFKSYDYTIQSQDVNGYHYLFGECQLVGQ